MVSKASEDLPEPDRPVMTISLSRGRSTSTLARLWVRAPRTRMVSRAMDYLGSERTTECTPPRRRGAKATRTGLGGQVITWGRIRAFPPHGRPKAWPRPQRASKIGDFSGKFGSPRRPSWSTAMAAGVKKVILVATVGRDHEVKYMPSGGAVVNLSAATNESWKDKQTGEKKERTEWHKLTFYNRLAEIVGEYVRKGQQIYIE